MLNAVQVRSVVYCRSDLGAPWGFRVPESPQAKFHLILRGPASVSLDNGDSAALEAGDLVLLPHGSGHVMKDGSSPRVRDLNDILKDHPVDATGTMHYGGRGAKTLLVCGEFIVDSAGELMNWLPPMVLLDTAANGLGRWLEPMTDLVRTENQADPGEAAIVAKVADVFLTDVLRHYLSTSSSSPPFAPLADDGDQAIAEAIALMHNRSGESWTVDALARQVGMSRTSFCTRFQAAVGSAPIAYLTRLRLARAAGVLAASTRPVIEIARAAGYDNESSFSKAFVRQYGQAPGQYRRHHRASVN
jgi:AraC-like DNA-binding protein